MASKIIDIPAVIQVIGNIYLNPHLLDYEDKYVITDEDFTTDFHKIVFGSIYKLYKLGNSSINLQTVCDFLNTRPKSKEVFDRNNGIEWIEKTVKVTNPSNFEYSYQRVKKFTLLRAFDNCGIDISDIYDPNNILDVKKKQQQEENLDNLSLEQIASIVNDKIELIKQKYVQGDYGEAVQAGDGLEELISSLEKSPEYGIPLYGRLINSVVRGARLGCLFLRSAPSGIGKSRSMAADACYFSCSKIYDDSYGMWIDCPSRKPTLFITTELDTSEVQTMFLAFISGVNEKHILDGAYVGDEKQRVLEAAKIIQEAPLYIECLSDFSIQDVENVIIRNIRDRDVIYVCFDYIHSSLKILSEVAQKTKGMSLREDNVLFMLSARLKDICRNYGIFIISATQLNGSWRESEAPDQNLLRGSKSIADRIDMGAVLLPVEKADLDGLEEILNISSYDKPTIKMSIYKNRRGEYKSIYLWCKADLGTCRINPLFATTWNYGLITIDDINISTYTNAW